jgi:hypothetical protein
MRLGLVAMGRAVAMLARVRNDRCRQASPLAEPDVAGMSLRLAARVVHTYTVPATSSSASTRTRTCVAACAGACRYRLLRHLGCLADLEPFGGRDVPELVEQLGGGAASPPTSGAGPTRSPIRSTCWRTAPLIAREPDLSRSGRSRYRIVEPLITFYEAVMRRRWAELEIHRTEEVWRSSRRSFLAHRLLD